MIESIQPRRYLRPVHSILLWLVAGPFAVGAAAQTPETARVHIGHVLEAFEGAPEGEGLLPTALAEATIAIEHSDLAGRDQTNVDPMIRHARHVMNALDPSAFASGPGLGFGVVAAAEAVARHVELAGSTDGAPDGVRTHAAHVAAAARSTAERAKEALALASQITRTSDYVRAYDLVGELQTLCEQLVSGVDLSADGQISWDGGEGGVAQAQRHMELLVGAMGED